MSILGSILWGIVTLMIMLLTIKYSLPRIQAELQEVASDDSEDVVTSAGIFMHGFDGKVITILTICVAFSAVCGYFAFLHGTSGTNIFRILLVMGVLACVFVTDWEWKIIPNYCLLILVIGQVMAMIFDLIWYREEVITTIIGSVIAAVVCLIIFLIIAKISRGGIGYGDVKLFGSIGFVCGLNAVLYTVLFSFVICAIVSGVLLITKKKGMKDSLPLGPFILIGYGIAVILAVL